MTLAVHYSSATPEHYTPRHIIDRAIRCLEWISLDPCSNSHVNPNVPAARHFTAADDGLAQEWKARTVWVNPPYGKVLKSWVLKLIEEYAKGNIEQALILVPARTDTGWFQLLRDYPICFVRGRLKFGDAVNSAPFPSAIVYLGANKSRFYECFHDLGDIYERVDRGSALTLSRCLPEGM